MARKYKYLANMAACIALRACQYGNIFQVRTFLIERIFCIAVDVQIQIDSHIYMARSTTTARYMARNAYSQSWLSHVYGHVKSFELSSHTTLTIIFIHHAFDLKCDELDPPGSSKLLH
jgi:hypothetical protein